MCAIPNAFETTIPNEMKTNQTTYFIKPYFTIHLDPFWIQSGIARAMGLVNINVKEKKPKKNWMRVYFPIVRLKPLIVSISFFLPSQTSPQSICSIIWMQKRTFGTFATGTIESLRRVHQIERKCRLQCSANPSHSPSLWMVLKMLSPIFVQFQCFHA